MKARLRAGFHRCADMNRYIETERSEGGGICTWYVVQGPEGAIQLMILDTKLGFGRLYDFGIHNKEPQYDGQDPLHAECQWLDAPCYFSASGFVGQRIYDEFMTTEDPEHLWKLLEDEYHVQFGS